MIWKLGRLVAQPIKCPALNFGSGQDLMILRSSAVLKTLSPSSLTLCLPLPLSALSGSQALSHSKKKKQKTLSAETMQWLPNTPDDKT